MIDSEIFRKLIGNPKSPNISEWVYEVESLLKEYNELDDEAKSLIQGIKSQGDSFMRCENLVALLKQVYKRRFENISIPEIKKRNQIFIAMMFSETTKSIYEDGYKPVIQSMNYSVMRIDEKEYAGSIINEIQNEISDSIALIADLTGNRGGVYYEAGIAKGLQLCNHPIKLLLTCQMEFFNTERVHFDVSGDNILLYDDVEDLKKKLNLRLSAVLKGGDKHE